VVVVGIIMTSLLGFFTLFQQGLYVEACMAAVDLDTPYLAWKHGREVVKGQDCHDWEKLRLRNSIWRSLPLAMMSFILSLRLLMEIPTCQMFATMGAGSGVLFPELTNRSHFVRDLRLNGVSVSELHTLQRLKMFAANIPHTQRRHMRRDAGVSLTAEGQAWHAAHCSDSVWEHNTLLGSQDVVQNWMMFVPVVWDRIEFGGIASGSLAAVNALTTERALELIYKEEKTLKPLVDRMLSNGRFEHRLFGMWITVFQTPWHAVVDQLLEAAVTTRDYEYEPVSTIQQSRPWTLAIGGYVLLRVKSGWKVKLFQTGCLLLVAMLPILKKILATSRIRKHLFTGAVITYGVLDMACLVTAWLLCSAAPLAINLGAAGEQLSAAAAHMMVDVVKALGNIPHGAKQDYDKAAQVFADVFLTHRFGETVSQMQSSLLPAIEWSRDLFLRLVAGSFMFLAASAVLASALSRARFAACLTSGICGPLWLVSEDAENDGHESQTRKTRGVCFVALSRSVLFAGLVALAWRNVDEFSTHVFFAMIFNRVVKVALLPRWLAFCAAHCSLGLAAALIIERSLEQNAAGAQSEEQLRNHTHMQGASSESAYGTFAPAKQGP